jgi:DNA-binding NarL/FixJ family response regulator
MMRDDKEAALPQGARTTTQAKVAQILIADDHALVREGLRTMLSGEDGLQVIAEAQDGIEALSLCRELEPDLVLMDVRMPKMDGLQATRCIKQELPKTSVMMVTMHENPDYLFEAVKAGAAGYVLKDASGERLLGAIRRTLEGESPLNQELAMQLLVRLAKESESRDERSKVGSEETLTQRDETEVPRSGAPRSGAPEGAGRGRELLKAGQTEVLTPREVEVLRLLSQGQTNPQIAENLLYSVSTVKAHVRSILSKLGVSDRTQAAVKAIEAGMFISDLG